MKLKLKGRRFDNTAEIQAESQRVLDTLTEKNFQEAFQKSEETVGPASIQYIAGTYFKGDDGRWALW
jgi:hypothetical protein